MKMKYFEIKEPYYALIKAESEELAIQVYVENVADDEDNTLQEEIIELGRDAALGKYVKCLNGDMLLSVVLKEFDEAEDLLLIDGSLL